MLVRLPGLLEQLAGFGRVAVLPEGEQGLGVGPGSRVFVGVLLEEPGQVVVPVEEEQEARQGVADALVVAGVQPQHVLQVLHGLVTTASGPEGMGQAQPGTHVRPGFEDAPEVADIPLKGFRPQRPLASGHALLVQAQGLLAAAGVFGQQDVGIGAVGADGQGVFRKLDPALLVGFLEGPVHERLGLGRAACPGRPGLAARRQAAASSPSIARRSGRSAGRWVAVSASRHPVFASSWPSDTPRAVQPPPAHCSPTPGSRFLRTVLLFRRLLPSRRPRKQHVQLPQPLSIPLVTGQTPALHHEIEPVVAGGAHGSDIQRQIINRYGVCVCVAPTPRTAPPARKYKSCRAGSRWPCR